MLSSIDCVIMSDGDDWAEKYRPEMISKLVGNDDKISKIRKIRNILREQIWT